MKTTNHPNDILCAEQDRLARELAAERVSERAMRKMRLRHRRALLWAGFQEKEIATLFTDAVMTAEANT